MSSEFKPRLAVVSSAVRNTLLMILALGCFAAAASAQGTIELGNQTPITNTFPFNFATPRGRFQSAYSASEMAPAAGKYITQIRVFGSSLSMVPTNLTPQYGNLRVRLAHTSTAIGALSTTFDANYTAPLVTVLGPVNLSITHKYLSLSKRITQVNVG